jgi:hypothetical protein
MNHQSDMTGMHVDNPLELQLLYSDKLFLDEKETFSTENHHPEAVGNEPEEKMQTSLPIAFFLDVTETQLSVTNDITSLLGRMLMVTSLDDKVPTIEMAEIHDLKSFSENQFNDKIKNHRKIIIFSDQWPFNKDQEATVFSELVLNETNIFWSPSIQVIMNNAEVKKDFAARLKQYFSNA